MIDVVIVSCYLLLLLGLGILSNRFFRGTAQDFFVASHSIGSFLLLMSVFGTTMTAFALVGSTGEAYALGIGVYGMMASWSGLVHSAVFFIVGIKLWYYGKRYGYFTQVQFFRARFESDKIGLVLFPVLVFLVIPYLLIGILAAGSVFRGMTVGVFPELFPATNGAVPPWLTGLVICIVVLSYVFMGGLRAAAWANTFQTCFFMVMGCIAFYVIANKLGGVESASQMVKETTPERLVRGEAISQLHFLTYFFVPLSVGMFPHLFQHWLTAKSAKTFRLTVIAHPIFIMIVWVPFILIGIWATSAVIPGPDGNMVKVIPDGTAPNAVLGIMVKKLAGEPLAGFLIAGILAAIMSSLDSQFMCLGTMFTNDIALHYMGRDKVSDQNKVWIARGFIVCIVLATYLLTLIDTRRVFTLGVWCFSGFASLFPLVFAALYWKRATKIGAYACIIVTALVWFYFFQDSNFGGDPEYLVLGMMPVVMIFISSVVTIFVVSLLTPAPSDEVIKKFFPKHKVGEVHGHESAVRPSIA